MTINKNTKSVVHNTSLRTSAIQYICIHYVGATGDAKNNVDYYSQPTVNNASADFFVGHNGDVWQYNPDPVKRYCWAVGGGRQSSYGGSFYGKAKNSNSVSIEMCVKTRGGMTANSPDWYFTDETLDAAVELTKYLMELYSVPAERVIRHFDVTGKICPGVVGWNYPSGDESAWEDFKARISTPVNVTDMTATGTVTADVLNVRGGPGTAYSSLGTLAQGAAVQITGSASGWYRIQYNGAAAWVSGQYIILKTQDTPAITEEEDDDMVRYNKLTDIPENCNFRGIIDDLMTAGIVGGDGSDPDGNDDVIDLSHDMVRMLVFEYRAGVYDDAIQAAGLDPDQYK